MDTATTMSTADHLRDANPWQREPDPIKAAILGKLIEELGELQAAAARCLIQGVDAVHPVTGKPNIDWLFEEMCDSENMIDFAKRLRPGAEPFEYLARFDRKRAHIEQWLAAFKPKDKYDIRQGWHIFMDGNKWCAVGPAFMDLQASPAGFGYTQREAHAHLGLALKAHPELGEIAPLADFTIHPKKEVAT